MKGPQKQYTDEMKRKFGYMATWLPGVPLKMGDIGVIRDNAFTRIAGLEDFNIGFDIREDETPEDLEYSSKGSVSVTTKLSGTITPPGSSLGNLDAGFIVEFSGANSILFKANKTKTNLIKNTIKLGDEVIKLYKEGKWNKKWVVITELVEAETATILISNTENAKIELKANANITLTKLDIADASLDLGYTHYKGLDTKVIAQSGLTPLFKVKGIHTNIFVPPVFKEKGITAFDFVTPATAADEFKDDLFFDYVSSDDWE
ncbi:hypothetical protein ACM44_00010 [Chryseobacterium koreense CCUG 49689]|uniref:Uncharacterized protein n=2 Tax=Chryseobacterium koreense TaxID=232216 RepID=A0A0J7J3C7_9FLAO|nr:hypothetical protein [Chryseobacterium koreense]KMQ72534.1 hypothetical protein ACM44_00010 [Chryseobacterium koreense CCUG 49689]MBB5332906.1 hypothetical protein [Chryseobacterium koreense]